jgi:hypothetical protein
MLFAVATQPLMDHLDAELAARCFQGVRITDTLTISYRLFADDGGMFIPPIEGAFLATHRCLEVYESASGAKLNLQKSVIIPFCLPSIPAWLIATQCHISIAGEIHKYLGAPWGFEIADTDLHNFYVAKISDRLKTWSKKLLSLPGRILLVKHVLQAIPIYHMMFIRLPNKTTTRIKQICRDFLWGFNQEGGRKTTLISWRKLTRKKCEGGIGFK